MKRYNTTVRKENTHYRDGNKVYTLDGTLEFNGAPENQQAGIWSLEGVTLKRGTTTTHCTGKYYINHGINKAKKYIRSNGITSFNI